MGSFILSFFCVWGGVDMIPPSYLLSNRAGTPDSIAGDPAVERWFLPYGLLKLYVASLR